MESSLYMEHDHDLSRTSLYVYPYSLEIFRSYYINEDTVVQDS